MLDEELGWHCIAPERRAADRERSLISISALIAWFNERLSRATIYREKYGKMPVDGVEPTGIADRIEIGPDHVAISDFKTGKPPTDEQVNSGLSPQLLLETAMLMSGSIGGVPKATPTELISTGSSAAQNLRRTSSTQMAARCSLPKRRWRRCAACSSATPTPSKPSIPAARAIPQALRRVPTCCAPQGMADEVGDE
ncbi:MAG: PD-(D/E)XK nuclease family protein [Caulobacteraceae bacterium]|nr:PD-(D/E)XK nuclease family protein [Caulobacteraceae bacterium]